MDDFQELHVPPPTRLRSTLQIERVGGRGLTALHRGSTNCAAMGRGQWGRVSPCKCATLGHAQWDLVTRALAHCPCTIGRYPPTLDATPVSSKVRKARCHATGHPSRRELCGTVAVRRPEGERRLHSTRHCAPVWGTWQGAAAAPTWLFGLLIWLVRLQTTLR